MASVELDAVISMALHLCPVWCPALRRTHNVVTVPDTEQLPCGYTSGTFQLGTNEPVSFNERIIHDGILNDNCFALSTVKVDLDGVI